MTIEIRVQKLLVGQQYAQQRRRAGRGVIASRTGQRTTFMAVEKPVRGKDPKTILPFPLFPKPWISLHDFDLPPTPATLA